MTQDPTRDEMLAYLASLPFASESDEFDVESSIYWFAADYHGGQSSNLYAALSASPFNPGAIASGPESGSMAEILYGELESEFAGDRAPRFSVTYEIVTPESTEHHDVDESGFLCRNVTLRDAIRELGGTRTNRVDGVQSVDADESPISSPRWITVTNGMEFETGAQESRSLHFPESLTASTRRRIARLLGAR